MNAEPVLDIVARIDALLPQTQCTRCGYPGCKPYAAAIVGGTAEINQCAPGGSETIAALAELLGRPARALNPVHGIAAAPGLDAPPRIAWIDESRCIGCARCLSACPVDAIVGAAKYMHTVLADCCTGCELCLPPCPVDCIELRAAPAPLPPPSSNRTRFEAHTVRLRNLAAERQRALDAKKAGAPRRPAGP